MPPDRKGCFRNRAIPFLRAHFIPEAVGGLRQEVSYFAAAVRDFGLAITNIGYATLRFGAVTCRLAVTGTGLALKSLHAGATETRLRSNIVSYAAFGAAIPIGMGEVRNVMQDAKPDFNQILGDGVGALILFSIAYATGPGSMGNNQVAPNKQVTLRKSILREAFPIRCISYLKDPEDQQGWRWLMARFITTGAVATGSYWYLGGYQAVARKWSSSGGSLLSYAVDRSSNAFRPYRAENKSFWEFFKAWVSNLAMVCLHDGIPVVVSMVVDYITMSAYANSHGQAMPAQPTWKDFKGGLVPMFSGTLVTHVVVSIIAKTSYSKDKRVRMVGHLLRLASRSGARYLINNGDQLSKKTILGFLSDRNEHVSLAMDFSSAAFMHRWGATGANKFMEGLMMDNIDVPDQPAPAEQKLVERKNMPSSRQRSQGQHFVIRNNEGSVTTTERSETITERSVTINSESSRELVIIDMPASNVPATNPHYGN